MLQDRPIISQQNIIRFCWNCIVVISVGIGAMLLGKLHIDIPNDSTGALTRLMGLLVVTPAIISGLLVVSFELAEVYVKRYPIKAGLFAIGEITIVLIILIGLAVFSADSGLIFGDVNMIRPSLLQIIPALAAYSAFIVALQHRYD